MNKVFLLGRVGVEPEIRYTLDGKPVATFIIATEEGEGHTEWLRIVAFGRLAEVCGAHLSKGMKVFIEGKLHYREYENREGQRRYVTEILAQSLQILEWTKRK